MRLEREKINTVLEYAYLFVAGIYIAYLFLETTVFELAWPNHFLGYTRLLLLLIILLRMFLCRQYTGTEMLLCAVIMAVFGIAARENAFPEVINIMPLLIGGKGISFRKILKVYLSVTVTLLLVTAAAALTGHIENLVYYQEGRNMRMSFGIIYPTDFSAHVLYSVLAWCYLRKEKIKYIELAVIGGLGIFVYAFCQARLNTICLFLIVVLFGYYKIQCMRAGKKGKNYEMHPFLSMILALAPVLCAGFMLFLSRIFRPENPFMGFLDNILSQRLLYGRKAFDVYGVSWLGKIIPMQGNGGNVQAVEDYFFLDSSYLFVLFQYGILVLFVVLGIMTVTNFRARKNKEWITLLTLLVVSVQCMIEHHLMSVAYNPFLWMLFAQTAEEQDFCSGTEAYLKNKRGSKEMKVCLVGSSGGHLTHLYMLKPFWKDKERFWVTFDKEDARSILEGEKVYPCYYPTNRNLKNLIRNTKVAWQVLREEKPDLLISSGAAVAVPFFYLAKLMGKKLIYIEVYDRIDKPTLTGKLVYPIVDCFIVQWEEQKKVYKKAVNLGGIF